MWFFEKILPQQNPEKKINLEEEEFDLDPKLEKKRHI